MSGRGIFPSLAQVPLLFQHGLFEEAEAPEAFDESELLQRVQRLRAQRQELELKREMGAERQNEVLAGRVMSAQEEFLSLQGEFKAMKERDIASWRLGF